MSSTRLKIFVGLSGGVDSAVSAALLQAEGHEVVGVFIKVWQADFLPCTWREERREAMRVAAHLQIPFVTLDLEKAYKEEVVDYMIREYGAGSVPNPDVMCNKHVKFGAFLDYALAHGADAVATGHYARVKSSDTSHQASEYAGQSSITSHQSLENSHQSSDARHQESVISHQSLENRHQSSDARHQGEGNAKEYSHNAYRLFSGVDREKDQSYFLWTLTQEQLARTFFPVGGLQKSEVRELAKKFGLPNAEKKDSQGLCFMGAVDMQEFLRHYLNMQPGNVLDEAGNIIGTHLGALVYAIGQRHGFTTRKISANELPYIVVGKNLPQNTITVSHREVLRKIGEQTHTWVENLHVICGDELVFKSPDITARIRYRGALSPVSLQDIHMQKHTARVNFLSPQEGLSSGQSIVFYRQDECIGGAVLGDPCA